jgi:hypothetical protein
MEVHMFRTLSVLFAAGILSFSVAAGAQTSTNPSNTNPSTPDMARPNNPSPGQGQPGTQGGQGMSSNNMAHEHCQRMADAAQRTKCLNDIAPSAGTNPSNAPNESPTRPGGTTDPGGSK